MKYEQFIAFRYLRAKRKQAFISLITLLSVAGVTVGVMALVVVIAVMSGAESDFRSRILGVESHVLLMRHGGNFTSYRDVIDVVKKIDGVENASPFVYTQVMLRSAFGSSGAVLRGIDPDQSVQMIKGFGQVDLQQRLADSRLSGGRDRKTGTEADASAGEGRGIRKPGIILGKELARTLGVAEGDSLYLISPRGMLSPAGHIPSMKRFLVTGVFESGMYEYDGSLAYIHIKDAQAMLRMGKAVSGLCVWVRDIYQADRIRSEIVSTLGGPYWARDWMQLNQSLFSALKLEKTAMFIILTLIVLVAAFNIASTLTMMVMEKTKDIAILKTMGATERSIRKIFVLNGMVIGFIGTFLGICSGTTLCAILKRYKFIELPDAYPFSTLPIQLEFLDVFSIAAAAMAICFIATIYPAYQAARLDPVEALRYG